MKIKFGLYFLLPLISVVTFNNSFAQEHEPGKTFSASQEKRIGEIAADYLRAHPEILIQMSEKLQHEQEAKQTRGFKWGLRANDVKNHVNRLTYCFILIIRCCIYSYSNDHGADGRWNAIPSRLIA
ncbi:hypothetical protein [Klebsiella michiganensis]|uniref:hypothetical protein n=1 Tax=Klebsiella michiganensis TaxID=1134687 RepID=UPI00356B66A1